MGRFSAAALLNPVRANTRVIPSRLAPVEIQVMGPGRLDVLNARNVSQTGIGIYVSDGFAGCDLDREVELVITLPRERSFLARGIIKHQTDNEGEGRHFGVEFTEITREHRMKIRDFVRTLV
jgi:hypothetical protein